MKSLVFRLSSFFAVMLVAIAFGMRIPAFAEANDTISVTQEGGSYYAEVGGETKRAESLSGLLSQMPDESRLLLCNLTDSQPLDIEKKKLMLSGKLTLRSEAISTFSGAKITFSGLELSLASSLRLRDTTLSVENSVLSSEKTVILLDKIGSGNFILKSGSVLTKGTAPAVSVGYGSAVLYEGSVSSAGKIAVDNSSILRLSRECDAQSVRTSFPIFLLDGAEVKPVSVYADMPFPDGEMTPVFFDADEEKLADIALYDGTGKTATLKFLSASARLTEKNVGAVCKPYIVSYYDENDIYSKAEIYSGEPIPLPEAKEREGCNFLGWFMPQGKYPVLPGETASSSLSLTAKYVLAEPSFALSSLSFSYDGAVHTLDFRTLSHPLEEEGIYSFAWLNSDEEVVGSSRALYISNVSDSGQYRCEITFLCRGDSVTVTTPAVSVKVSPKTVDYPTLPILTYSGSLQFASLLPTAAYTVSDEGGTHAGKIPVTLKLSDPENTAFSDGKTPSATLYYEILPAQNRFVSLPDLPDYYEGAEPKPSAASAFGTPRFLYSVSPDGSFTEQVPTEAGEYYLRACVDATADYFGLLSDPIVFHVLSEVAVGLRVLTPPVKTVYTAFETFDPTGMKLLLTYTSGRTESPSPSLLSIRYAGGDSFRVKDGCVYLSFAGLTCVQTVTVTPASYDLSALTFTDGSVVFDGKEHTIDYSGSLPTGKDGKTLSCQVSGGGVHVGSYSVSLVFSGGSEDYQLPASLSATLTVTPLAVDLLYADLLFTYDGTAKLPTASCRLPDGTEMPISLTGAALRAGTYTAEAIADPDLTYNNPTVSFTVLRASYDLSSVRWKGGDYTYDGSLKSVRLADLPAGVSVVGYADADATEAGIYTASAAFSYDSQNYLAPAVPSYVWRVEKADYDLSGFSLSDATFVFDGNPHYPSIVGQIAPGYDGSKPICSFGDGAIHAGKGQTVVLTFNASSMNYNTPKPINGFVDILPAVAAVTWDRLVYTYDGEAHLPRAYSPAFGVTVTGEATHAGSYTAHAVSDDPDYEIENPTVAFSIEKAENFWTVLPVCPDVYEGKPFAPIGEAISGDVVFSYFRDAECLEPLSDLPRYGNYFFVAAVEEGEDYFGLSTEPVAFSVLEVLPVSLSVEANRTEYVAFDTVGEGDLIVTLYFNSGDTKELSFEEYTVSYPSGESLRFGNGEIAVSASGFSASVPVSVGRATYDLSAANYIGLSVIYNGNVQSPVLAGLPEGVTVAEPLPACADAGRYVFVPTLSYDSVNYEKPVLPEETFVISPAVLGIPVAESIVYSGIELVPEEFVSDLFVCSLPDGIHAGHHEAILALTDPRNYVFSDGSGVTSVGFEILPRKLTLSVAPVTVYLFETEPEITWSIASGEILEGEDAGICLSVYGNSVVGEAQNRNYRIVLPETEVVRVRKLSPSVETAVWILVGVVLFFAVGIFFFLRNFEAISRFVAGKENCREEKKKRRLGIMTAENDIAELRKMIAAGEEKEDAAVIPMQEESEEIESDREVKGSDEEKTVAPVPSEKTDFSAELIPPPSPKTGFFSDFCDEVTDELTPKDICLPSPLLSVDVFHAESLLSDSAAKVMVERGNEPVFSGGFRRGIVNVDSLGNAFCAGDKVDINGMKAKGLVPKDVLNVKVLARGKLDKPLTVVAADFSPSAIKMILLTGGHAVRISSTPKTPLRNEEES